MHSGSLKNLLSTKCLQIIYIVIRSENSLHIEKTNTLWDFYMQAPKTSNVFSRDPVAHMHKEIKANIQSTKSQSSRNGED